MSTDFLTTASLLSAAQAEIAAQVAALASAASPVAALAATAVGQETDAQRVRRLESLFNSALGDCESQASKLQGMIAGHRQALAAELFSQRGNA
jgi:hypothetical protein